MIPFDLTTAIKYEYIFNDTIDPRDIRCFVSVVDGCTDDEYDILLGTVSIVEPMTGWRVTCSNEERVVAGQMGAYKYVDFDMAPFIGNNQRQEITLTFSSNINVLSVEDNIFFITPSGEVIYPRCEIDGSRVIISPPENKYMFDTKYELHIKSGVQSLGGNYLQNESVILIYILGELPNNDISWL